jgi:aminoglycoside phosphotransferase (APT) family kinase protein
MNPQQVLSTVVKSLKATPLTVERMTFTHSGSVIYSIELPGRSVILRASTRCDAFAYTERNIKTMRGLGIPVPTVVASGIVDLEELWTYIILNKIPGRDLYYELTQMSRVQITRLAEQIVSFQASVSTLPHAEGYGWGQIGIGGPDPTWFYVFQSDEEAAPPESNVSRLDECRIMVHGMKVRLQPYLNTIRPICFLDDLTTKNVLIEDDCLTGIIDLDCVCFGDPLWTIGATGGCIVSDIGPEHLFYFEELCRCTGINAEQRQAVNLYASLRALEFLEMAIAENDSPRADRLVEAIGRWTSE